MRAQSPNSNLPRQTRRRFGRNLASSPFSSFMFVTEPLPRIPVFQQRIKIPRPPPPGPGDTNPAYARLPAWRAPRPARWTRVRGRASLGDARIVSGGAEVVDY